MKRLFNKLTYLAILTLLALIPVEGMGADEFVTFQQTTGTWQLKDVSISYADGEHSCVHRAIASLQKDFEAVMITGYRIRVEKSKLTTVRALQGIGFETIAAGDSFNDLGMIQASKAGILFRSTEQIRKDHPELPACETYDDLLALIRKAY